MNFLWKLKTFTAHFLNLKIFSNLFLVLEVANRQKLIKTAPAFVDYSDTNSNKIQPINLENAYKWYSEDPQLLEFKKGMKIESQIFFGLAYLLLWHTNVFNQVKLSIKKIFTSGLGGR